MEVAQKLPPKTPWSSYEDNLLKDAVKRYGEKKWNFIATFIPGRTGKQCRERWMAHISPNVRTDEFTNEEINLLLELHQRFGNSWSIISQFFDRRPPNVIKNKFNCILRKTRALIRPLEKIQKHIMHSAARRCINIPIQNSNSIIRCHIDEDFQFDSFDGAELVPL